MISFIRYLLIGGIMTLVVVFGVALMKQARSYGNVDAEAAARQVRQAVVQARDGAAAVIKDKLDTQAPAEPGADDRQAPAISEVLRISTPDTTTRIENALNRFLATPTSQSSREDTEADRTMDIITGLLRALDSLEEER